MITLEIKIILAIILSGCLFLGYNWIGANAVSKYVAKQAIAQAAADKAQQERYNTLAESFESLKHTREVQIKVVEKRVNKIVEREVYRQECFDEEGLAVANKALAGKIED